MKKLIVLFFSFGVATYNISYCQIFNNEYKLDSATIHSLSTKFYDWYFLDQIGPVETWDNERLFIDTEMYYNELEELDIVSSRFFESEQQKFDVCYKDSKEVPFKKVYDCGCSIAMLADGCDFLNYIYWMFSQEKYDGFFVEGIEILGDNATSKIKFYYEDQSERYIDKENGALVLLHRYDTGWLIDNIKRKD